MWLGDDIEIQALRLTIGVGLTHSGGRQGRDSPGVWAISPGTGRLILPSVRPMAALEISQVKQWSTSDLRDTIWKVCILPLCYISTNISSYFKVQIQLYSVIPILSAKNK